MTRAVKVLGTCMVVALAMASVASSAFAVVNFKAESAPIKLLGVPTSPQDFAYEAGGLTFECQRASFTGVMTVTETSFLELYPEYTNCKDPAIAASATVSTVGCNYRYRISGVGIVGPMELKCLEGHGIDFRVSVPGFGEICTLRIAPQGFGDFFAVHYSNTGSGSGRRIIAQHTMGGIHATRTGSAICGAASSTTATYHGTSEIQGMNPTTLSPIGFFEG